ncbi:MAG: hypothetical protein AAB134_08015, partial [Pseudomonadota bacterium]
MYARTLWFVVCFAVSAVAVAGPKIEYWTLPNGARVYFVPAHELPMVQMRAVFDAGSSRDPAGKPGLARLVNGLLDEGAALFLKSPALALWSGAALALAVLGVNLLGDALRDR